MTLYMSLRTSYGIVYDMGIDGANVYPVRDPEEMEMCRLRPPALKRASRFIVTY